MAIANISLVAEINDWKNAVYGEEVRAANVSAFEKIQGTVNDAIQEVAQVATDAANTTAASAAAVQAANNTLTSAAQSATSAASSAKQSQSWAVGGTSSRTGEDTDNSKYYSMQSGLSAQAAVDAANKAETYAGFVVPTLSINMVTGYLEYTTTNDIVFTVNTATGQLDYELVA